MITSCASEVVTSCASERGRPRAEKKKHLHVLLPRHMQAHMDALKKRERKAKK